MSSSNSVSSTGADAALDDVSPAHQVDQKALHSYLADSIEGFKGELVVKQFTHGQSNPTFQLTASIQKWEDDIRLVKLH